jgi:CHAD domain-containing protein
MDSISTNPIHTLRQRATCLEAAISVSLGDPTRKAVHELRSETRRIEALLDLLQNISGLPGYREAADPLRRRLRKLRRLAGKVRDCDVQRRLLTKETASESQVEAASDLREDRDKLRKLLKRDRIDAEVGLGRFLRRQQSKLTRALEDVFNALKPVEKNEVPAQELLERVERSVGRALRFHRLDQKRLHDVRKAAKHARYQCEALPGAGAAAFAKRLEDLQDKGGAWHDLLVLAERASKELGADHALPRALQRDRDEHLNLYLEKLEDLRHGRADLIAMSPPRRKVPLAVPKNVEASSNARRPPQRETAPRGTGMRLVRRKMSA